MTMTNRWRRAATTGAGAAGAIVVACGACCLPLAAPVAASMFAGAGMYHMDGLNSWHVAGVVGLAFAATVGWISRRRASARMSPGACGCQAGCVPEATAPGKSVTDAAKSAPVACTLSAANLKTRAAWLRELTARALVDYQLDGSRLRLSYQLDAVDDIETMVSQERECCGFLHYAVRRTATSIEVTVSAPADASANAHTLFSHLIPR